MFQPPNFEGTRLNANKPKHDDNPNSYIELRRLADEKAAKQQKVEAVGASKAVDIKGKATAKPKPFLAVSRLKGTTAGPAQPPRVGGPKPRS